MPPTLQKGGNATYFSYCKDNHFFAINHIFLQKNFSTMKSRSKMPRHKKPTAPSKCRTKQLFEAFILFEILHKKNDNVNLEISSKLFLPIQPSCDCKSFSKAEYLTTRLPRKSRFIHFNIATAASSIREATANLLPSHPLPHVMRFFSSNSSFHPICGLPIELGGG